MKSSGWLPVVGSISLVVVCVVGLAAGWYFTDRDKPKPPTPDTPDIAGPVVELPGNLTVRSGRSVVIKARTSCKVVKWQLAAGDGDLIPWPTGHQAVFTPPKPGVYRVVAWVARGDIPSDWSVCLVHAIEQDPPTPPGPTPPKPPDPPAPPLDDLTVSVLNAYKSETGMDKAERLVRLRDFYKRMVATNFPASPDLRTAGMLLAAAHKTAEEVVGPIEDGVLPKVRGAIADYLDATLKTENVTVLDTDLRKRYLAAFSKIANSLSEVK